MLITLTCAQKKNGLLGSTCFEEFKQFSVTVNHRHTFVDINLMNVSHTPKHYEEMKCTGMLSSAVTDRRG